MNYMLEESIRELRHPSWKKREEAAIFLGNRRAMDAVPALLEALSDESAQVAFAAMNALVKIGTPAIEGLSDLLNNADSSVRYAAVVTLGDIGDESAVSTLIHTLQNDPVENVQNAASEALQKIGTPEALEATNS